MPVHVHVLTDLYNVFQGKILEWDEKPQRTKINVFSYHKSKV